jgi:hypothetical protein
MMHILLLPLIAAAHIGDWINNHVLTPFLLGTTAKDILEEELGVYGVQAYLIYKVSRLIVESWPLLEPRWLAGRVLRALALAAALLVSAWLLTCLYIGVLIPIVDLRVSYGGLLLSPAVAWLVLGYVMLAERVRAKRAELEAQEGTED